MLITWLYRRGSNERARNSIYSIYKRTYKTICDGSLEDIFDKLDEISDNIG